MDREFRLQLDVNKRTSLAGRDLNGQKQNNHTGACHLRVRLAQMGLPRANVTEAPACETPGDESAWVHFLVVSESAF